MTDHTPNHPTTGAASQHAAQPTMPKARREDAAADVSTDVTQDLLKALKHILPWAEKWAKEMDAQSVGSLYPRIRAAAISRARQAIAAAEGSAS